jgi:hypothetical protein
MVVLAAYLAQATLAVAAAVLPLQEIIPELEAVHPIAQPQLQMPETLMYLVGPALVLLSPLIQAIPNGAALVAAKMLPPRLLAHPYGLALVVAAVGMRAQQREQRVA